MQQKLEIANTFEHELMNFKNGLILTTKGLRGMSGNIAKFVLFEFQNLSSDFPINETNRSELEIFFDINANGLIEKTRPPGFDLKRNGL